MRQSPLLLATLTATFLLTAPAVAQDTNIRSGDNEGFFDDVSVDLKTPQPRIGVPGLSFTPVQKDAEGGYIYVSSLGEYIAAIYKYAVAIASIVAVVMIIAAGFMWTASGGNPEMITGAKKRIAGAVTGLILIAGSYTILYAINPELVQFRALRVKYVEQKDYEEFLAETGALEAGDGLTLPTWDARTFDCTNKNVTPAGVTPESQTISYTCPVGVFGKITSIREMKDSLCKVGEILNKQGYGVQITDSYRSFSRQVNFWCVRGAQQFPNVAERSRAFAIPGTSTHGIGISVDAHLTDASGKRYYTGVTAKNQCEVDKKYVRILANAFAEADKDHFARLSTEIWHFEYIKAGVNPKPPARDILLTDPKRDTDYIKCL